MKRYYLDRLNIFQSIIRSIIINIFLNGFIFLIYKFTKLTYDLYLYIFLIVISFFVFFYELTLGRRKISFYIINNSLYYSGIFKDIKIDLEKVTMIEEYIGLNYLFGFKTIYLYVNRKKYAFQFKNKRAKIFKNELEQKLNNNEIITNLNI